MCMGGPKCVRGTLTDPVRNVGLCEPEALERCGHVGDGGGRGLSFWCRIPIGVSCRTAWGGGTLKGWRLNGVPSAAGGSRGRMRATAVRAVDSRGRGGRAGFRDSIMRDVGLWVQGPGQRAQWRRLHQKRALVGCGLLPSPRVKASAAVLQRGSPHADSLDLTCACPAIRLAGPGKQHTQCAWRMTQARFTMTQHVHAHTHAWLSH